MDDDFFAPPAFQAEAALASLRRSLRELRLTEREGRYEWRGMPVVELALEAGTIRARRVKQPARTPEWTAATLKNGAEVRRYVEDTRRWLERWNERDD